MQAFGDGFDLYAAVGDAVMGFWDSGTTTVCALVVGRFTGSQAMQIKGTATAAMVKSSGANV